MLKLYYCDKNDIENTLKNVITPNICGDYRIERTQNGKPYIVGNPLYFSVSHSDNRAVIAICDKPVGVDCEIIRERKISGISKRLSEREQAEIGGNTLNFLYNWTAKEAFIKMIGGTLASCLKHLEFFESKIYMGGKLQNCTVKFENQPNFVVAVCTR